MNSAALSAKELLDIVGRKEPSDISVEEIAWALGLVITRKKMDGCEGRILMHEDSGIISINSDIQYQPKINYILAHEIGHFRLHKSLSLFSDSQKTLTEWYAKGNHEKEANDFACELLMPRDSFIRKVKSKKLDLRLIEDTANYFETSKTATFLRYRDLGSYPVMIVFIEKGIIKWKSHSSDFPFTWLPYGQKVPAYTVAGDFFYRGIEEPNPVKVNALDWFPEDYKLAKEGNSKLLWEQCFPTTKESILTCLWPN